MKIETMSHVVRSILIAAGIVLPAGAQIQSYPVKPILMVSPLQTGCVRVGRDVQRQESRARNVECEFS
jgi:hypothetical protein